MTRIDGEGRVLRWQLRAGLAAVVLATALPVGAKAQGPVAGDAVVGRELAARLCSNCHAVDAGGAGITRGDVPSFAVIAASPRTTADRLAGAIIMPHPEMPGVPLTRNETRDIIAYILSLRRAP